MTEASMNIKETPVNLLIFAQLPGLRIISADHTISRRYLIVTGEWHA